MTANISDVKKSKDDTLRRMADRIQARAIRRCGELLKQIEPAKNQHGRATTRADAAIDAGLSEHQRKTALRVASIPEMEFHDAVEAEVPPTVTQLAERGKAVEVATWFSFRSLPIDPRCFYLAG